MDFEKRGQPDKNPTGARRCARCRLCRRHTFDGQRKCVHDNHSVADDLALQEAHDLQRLARAGVHDLGEGSGAMSGGLRARCCFVSVKKVCAKAHTILRRASAEMCAFLKCLGLGVGRGQRDNV